MIIIDFGVCWIKCCAPQKYSGRGWRNGIEMELEWGAASYGLDLTDEPLNADCGALYGPFIRHTPPAFVYFTVVSVCKSSRNLDLLCFGQ